MPIVILLIPALVVLIVCGILFFIVKNPMPFGIALIPTVIYIFIGFIFREQINQWWYQKYPPRLDPDLRKRLSELSPFYRQLGEAEQKDFERRVFLFMLDKEFRTMELPKVYDDFKLLATACAIQVTFGLEQYMLPHWGMFVFYRQAFHSPQLKEFHSGERHAQDGCIILATDPLAKALQTPKEHYNMGLHQIAMALQYELKLKNEDFLPPKLLEKKELLFNQLKTIRGQKPETFEREYLHFKEELFGICVEHFFNVPRAFKQELPDTYKALKKILRQDPIRKNGTLAHG